MQVCKKALCSRQWESDEVLLVCSLHAYSHVLGTHAAGRLPVRKLLYSCNLISSGNDPFAPQLPGMLPAVYNVCHVHVTESQPASNKQSNGNCMAAAKDSAPPCSKLRSRFRPVRFSVLHDGGRVPVLHTHLEAKHRPMVH